MSGDELLQIESSVRRILREEMQSLADLLFAAAQSQPAEPVGGEEQAFLDMEFDRMLEKWANPWLRKSLPAGFTYHPNALAGISVKFRHRFNRPPPSDWVRAQHARRGLAR